MEEKVLGKISKAEFCIRDFEIGFLFELTGKGWGVTTSYMWRSNRSPTIVVNNLCGAVELLLLDAKVSELSQLVGKPIEAEFKSSILQNFRILTEVL